MRVMEIFADVDLRCNRPRSIVNFIDNLSPLVVMLRWIRTICMSVTTNM